MKKVLVIGAAGQIGTELVQLLVDKFGQDAVIASDIKEDAPSALKAYNYMPLNVLDGESLTNIVKEHNVTEVYLLAALLSATAEQQPKFAWQLNMEGLFNVLDLAKDGLIKKVFWPSSIAVFGPTTPKNNTPQHTIMEPSTVYGISKQAGEQWCNYYFEKYGVDVRSIRYPGLISYTALPGGGTTDYAVDIFYHAKKYGKYTSFVNAETRLPMMYMNDAVRATVELMEAPAEKIKIRNSYNLAGISFTPEDLTNEIRKHIPSFEIDYEVDFRQEIADTWPDAINDERAQKEWGWKQQYDLKKLTSLMLEKVDTDAID
ncbi:NAD-dependent epimerase [Brumimicrobium salinarum]|uniref:NAD-dependent epimerase n=1 Tax=Brumimicrobium salinarum TaxID=2058658 RepID=A0A2I0R6L0_9FLAO|nr:NAD-dependent epimerase/dehydratase family protein [Brumimicrobium salinarum]PKR82204.1 NAD-dependent epimerase [Brumimicrobium salinarum]